MSLITAVRAGRPAIQLVRAGFRQQSQYRLAMVAGLLTNCVFGFIRASVLLTALEASTGSFGGYDRRSLTAYVWISQALLGSIILMSPVNSVSERIKSGDIAIDFLRPLPLLVNHTATALGRGLYTLVPRGIPALVVGTLSAGFFLPLAPGPYLLGTLSVVVAITASYLGTHCVALVGFWVVETRGLSALYGIAATFLAGLVVPVGLFPDWLRTLASLTPFPTFLQYPVDVLSGRVVGAEAWSHLGTQLLWLVLLIALAQLLTRLGRRHLEVQGG